MFKRVLLGFAFLFCPFTMAKAVEYSENLVVLAGSNNVNTGGDDLVEVSDDEVDNLILYLEDDPLVGGAIKNENDVIGEAVEDDKDPYADMVTALNNHQVNGLNRNIIMGMVVKDTPTNLLSGIMLLYSNISNFFLHPLILLFIITILVLFVITVVLGFLSFKKEDFVSGKKYLAFAGFEIILVTYLAALIYEDFLGFTVYRKYMMGVLYLILSIIVGFVLGSIFSKFYFEDKILP